MPTWSGICSLEGKETINKMTLVNCLCTAALVCMGTFAATQDQSTPSRQSQEVQQETKTSTATGTTTIKTDTVNGKVQSFEPGKSIKVTVPGKSLSTRSWSLDNKDWTYNIPNNLKPGDWVRISEKTDNNGHKTVTVQPMNQGTASRSRSSSY
jgi:hypothetical protein